VTDSLTDSGFGRKSSGVSLGPQPQTPRPSLAQRSRLYQKGLSVGFRYSASGTRRAYAPGGRIEPKRPRCGGVLEACHGASQRDLHQLDSRRPPGWVEWLVERG
jgi:hypothetical protein